MKRESTGQSTEKNFEEKLIDAIREHDCLFHKESIFYRKKNVKQKAWLRVSAETGADVKECQHRWRSLRDRFVRETKSKSHCKWRYMNNLLFLKPHLDSRETNTKASSSVCKTDEESCTQSENNCTTVEYEVTPRYLEDSVDESLSSVNYKQIITNVEKDAEVSPEEIAFISMPPSSSFVSIPRAVSNSPETKTTTTKTKSASKSKPKRKRIESQERWERFGMSSKYEEEDSKTETETPTKSRNEDYYKTLESYMLRLPHDVQDDLKIEILNRVHSEIKKQRFC